MSNIPKNALAQCNRVDDIRRGLETDIKSGAYSDRVRQVFSNVVDIIKIWQNRACGSDPTNCALSFLSPAVTVTVTLGQVLALMPQTFQYKVDLWNGTTSGSWLDENLMNLIIRVEFNCDGGQDTCPGTYFAQSLATDCSVSLDELTIAMTGEFGFQTRLAQLKDQMEQGADWNSLGLYTVPADVDRIVCFWNYYENHWTVLSIDISHERWIYRNFNSLSDSKNPTKKSIHDLGLDLGELIRAASDIECPERNPRIIIERSAEQNGIYDCGIFAIENVISLLQRREPPLLIDPIERRIHWLKRILSLLQDGSGVNCNFAKLSPEEQYWWRTLRPLMESGSDQAWLAVSVGDRILSKVQELHPDDTALAVKFLSLIKEGLAAGLSNVDLIDNILELWELHGQ